jgi:hypothetical protein
MVAIQTKYIGPTNSRGSRIKAWTDTGFSTTISYDYGLEDEARHFKAVKAMVESNGLDWDLKNMRCGGTKNGYVFCFSHSVVGA